MISFVLVVGPRSVFVFGRSACALVSFVLVVGSRLAFVFGRSAGAVVSFVLFISWRLALVFLGVSLCWSFRVYVGTGRQIWPKSGNFASYTCRV